MRGPPLCSRLALPYLRASALQARCHRARQRVVAGSMATRNARPHCRGGCLAARRHLGASRAVITWCLVLIAAARASLAAPGAVQPRAHLLLQPGREQSLPTAAGAGRRREGRRALLELAAWAPPGAPDGVAVRAPTRVAPHAAPRRLLAPRRHDPPRRAAARLRGYRGRAARPWCRQKARPLVRACVPSGGGRTGTAPTQALARYAP